jgi:hypothetical protein
MVGFMPILARHLYADGIDPPSMLLWRYAIALPALADCAAAATRVDLIGAWRGGAWRIALVGATLGVGQTITFWESIKTLDTSVAALLFYTYPALTTGARPGVVQPADPGAAVLCVAIILRRRGVHRRAGAARRDDRSARPRLGDPVAADLCAARIAGCRRGGNIRPRRAYRCGRSAARPRLAVGAWIVSVTSMRGLMPSGDAGDVERLGAVELQGLAVVPSLNCSGSTPMPTRFERWMRSKLSAITALTPSSACPWPPSRATSRCRIPCRR